MQEAGGTRPTALVTGASAGIGAAIARELAGRGHDLVLTARRAERLQAMAAELARQGAAATVIPADLSRPGAAAELAGELDRRGIGAPDVLINNAGLGDARDVAETSLERLEAMLAVNIVALTMLTRLLLPGMIARRRGRIMLVASTAAFQPGPGMAVYCASKAYVLSLGEALSQELRGTGVTVTTLCPGTTDTEFFAVAGALDRPLSSSGLVRKMAAATVARAGVDATLAGRRTVVPGWHNKLTAALSRLVPRRLLLPAAHRMLSGRGRQRQAG